MNGLILKNACLKIAGKRLFRQFNLHVRPGEVVTLMGPSGCGKSSLLSWIIGSLPPIFETSGEAHLYGVNILSLPAEKRQVGILFQDSLLFPHLNVAQNLSFGLASKYKGKARMQKLQTALEKVEMASFLKTKPAGLSGGQQARVALLRTLLSEPKALLLDEPFAKLDLKLKLKIQQLVFDQVRAYNLPTLLVTHEQQDADAAGGLIVGFGHVES